MDVDIFLKAMMVKDVLFQDEEGGEENYLFQNKLLCFWWDDTEGQHTHTGGGKATDGAVRTASVRARWTPRAISAVASFGEGMHTVA